MSTLDEIRLLIQECTNMPDGLGNPILDKQEAEKYLHELNMLDTAAAINKPRFNQAEDLAINGQLKDAWYECVGACPICGMQQTEGKEVNIEGRTATQECYCLCCSSGWIDTYIFEGHEILCDNLQEPNI